MNTPTEAGNRQTDTSGDRETFAPESYRPTRKDGVLVLDRGETEPKYRYVLRDMASGKCVAISSEDVRLWNMFDGKQSVQDILQKYVKHHRTLPLDRLVDLVRKLWQNGFLTEDPAFYGTAQPQRCALARVRSRLSAIKIPVLGLHKIPALLDAVALPRVLWKAIAALLTAAGALGLFVAYLDNAQLLASLSLYTEFVGSYVLVLLLALAFNLLFSAVRETVRALALLKSGVAVLAGGMVLRWGVPLAHFDTSGLLAKPRRQRLELYAAGLLSDIVLVGLLSLGWYARSFLASNVMFIVLVLAYLRLLLSACPFMDNDLYLLLTDWLDEPNLRRKTWGFIRSNFGRAVRGEDLKNCAPYLGFALFCVLWTDCIVSLGLACLNTGGQLGQARPSAKRVFAERVFSVRCSVFGQDGLRSTCAPVIAAVFPSQAPFLGVIVLAAVVSPFGLLSGVSRLQAAFSADRSSSFLRLRNTMMRQKL